MQFLYIIIIIKKSQSVDDKNSLMYVQKNMQLSVMKHKRCVCPFLGDERGARRRFCHFRVGSLLGLRFLIFNISAGLGRRRVGAASSSPRCNRRSRSLSLRPGICSTNFFFFTIYTRIHTYIQSSSLKKN